MHGKTLGVNKRLWPCWYLEHGRDGLLFQALPEEGLAEKKSQARGGKKSKTRLTIAFFVSAAAEKVKNQLLFGEVLNRDVSRSWPTLNVLMTCITIQVKNDGW